MAFLLIIYLVFFSQSIADQWVSILNPITFSEKTFECVLSNGGYAIISAGRNPAILSDLYLNDEMIENRTKNLINDIKNIYLHSSISGVYDGGNETKKLIQLGEKYNQDSIIYVKQTKPTIQKLIYTTGRYQGKYVQGQGYEKLPMNITDNYSRIELCPNNIFQFTLNFNFKRLFLDRIQIRTNQLIDYHNRNRQANKEKCSN